MSEPRINNQALMRLAFKEEPRFLSVLLKDKECLMDSVSFGIKGGTNGHFWNPEAKFLYEVMHSYYLKHGASLTRVAMDSIMDSMETYAGQEIDEDQRTRARIYWDKTYNLEATSEDYTLLRDNINARYVQWQAVNIVKSSLDELVKSTNNQVEVVRKVREKFITIDNMEGDSYTLIMDVKEGMEKTLAYIKNRRENPDDLPTIPTGLRAIDDIYCGFEFGSYTIISGMINGGKTTLMFNIGFNMARAGYNVVYVSLEKKAVPLFTRLLSLHALVDYNRIKRGGNNEQGLNEENYNKLTEAARDLLENVKPNFDIIQSAQGTKLSKILSKVEQIKSQKKIDVLIVDYLGVIGNETAHSGRADLDDALTSQRLQAYGRINDFVTISAVQLKTPSSEGIRKKAKKATESDTASVEVNTEDLAGSKMIIADADNGLSAVLNADYPPTKMFVFGTKARDDEARRTMVLDFDGRIGRVSDPIFEPGQVSGVDDILYNTDITEDELASENRLYGTDDEDDLVFPDFEADSKKEDNSVQDILDSDDEFNSMFDVE